MEKILTSREPKHVALRLSVITIAIFGLVSVIVPAPAWGGGPLFSSVEQFVLFATDNLELDDGTQVSSDDLGSNNKLELGQNVSVASNLFAKTIELEKNVIVDGNINYRKLKKDNTAQILGAATGGVQLPIANLPDVPEVHFGGQSHTITGTTTTLAAGNYKDIIITEGSALTLESGIYNLRSLVIKNDATLLFIGSTTINIQFKLRGHNRVAILPGANTKPDDLTINYRGIKQKTDKSGKENDDEEINALLDDQEKKDQNVGKISRPVLFGERSFLNFKLLAPKANIIVGKESTLRGQVLGRRIKMKKEGVVSHNESFSHESDPTKIVETDGTKFIGNELLIGLTTDGLFSDAQIVAQAVGGRVVGFDPNPPLYQILLPTTGVLDVENAIQTISNLNNPRIVGASTNYILE